MGIETLVGGALGLIGSSMQSDAVSDASSTQAKSSADAIAEQRRQYDISRQDAQRIYDTSRADFAPYRAAGVNALSQLQSGISTPTTAADVMADPGYQFGLDQGQQAIDRKIAAMGGRVSGAAIKVAGRFGTNYATTGYTAADQRRNDRLNRLAALAGIGQTATGSSAAAGSAMAGANQAAGINAANNISGLMTGQGNATAGAQVAQGNIWGNAANEIAALYRRNNNNSGVGPMLNGGGFSNTPAYLLDPN